MKQVGNHWIPANGTNVTFLDRRSFKHPSGRYNFYPVIIHINMYLISKNDIVTMDQGIHKGLSYCTICKIRLVFTVTGFFSQNELLSCSG